MRRQRVLNVLAMSLSEKRATFEALYTERCESKVQERWPVLPAVELSSQRERSAAVINIDESEPKDGHMPIALLGNRHLFWALLLRCKLPIITRRDYDNKVH